MALILNSAGEPEPSSEISRRLKAIHAGLHLRFVNSTAEHWATCMSWQPDDRRWESIQNGQVDPSRAYDIIGYIPLACSVDEAPAYLERYFRGSSNEEVRNMADSVTNWNTMGGQLSSVVEEAIGEVLDMPDPSSTKSKRSRKK